VTLLGAAAATAVVARSRAMTSVWWFAVGVAVLSVPHALLAWHGDGMEAARHALVACVQLRIGVVLMVAVAIGASARRSAPARETPTELSTR
jgi:hypothetical protein